MNVRMYIWVTSECNLTCPYCIQRYTMDQNKGYSMSVEEILYIVNSCRERGIHFGAIELTGGEASLWEHLEIGVQQFSKICDRVTLATNGNNPERVIALGLDTWIVSESQATKEQMAKYDKIRHKLTVNSHKHKKMPDHPVPDSLPSLCCTRQSPQLESQIALEYIRGKVWYCPDAFAHTEHTGVYDEIVCDFEDDFLTKFKDKKYDQKICQYCLGNQKIWDKL